MYMITNELIEYIKFNKNQNISNESIRESLLQGNWSEEDVDQAFVELDASTNMIQSPVHNELYSDNDRLDTKKKPKVIKVISMLLSVIASTYILSTVSILGFILLFDNAIGSSGAGFSLLKNFPTFGVIPILLSFVSVYFFYVSFKVTNGSKFSLGIALSSLLIIPPTTALVSQILMSQFIEVANSFGNADTTSNVAAQPMKVGAFSVDDPIFLLVIISVLILVISFKKFTFQNDPLVKKARLFLVFLILILVIPTISLISINLFKVQEKDYGYETAMTAVSYHIYKPSIVPNGIDYASDFTLNEELAGKNNGVLVVFDIPVEKQMSGEDPKAIFVRQVGVEPGFAIADFAATYVENSSFEQISIVNAYNGIGYVAQKPLGSSSLNSVIFLTNDSTLITIMSLKATSEELRRFAESFE